MITVEEIIDFLNHNIDENHEAIIICGTEFFLKLAEYIDETTNVPAPNNSNLLDRVKEYGPANMVISLPLNITFRVIYNSYYDNSQIHYTRVDKIYPTKSIYPIVIASNGKLKDYYCEHIIRNWT